MADLTTMLDNAVRQEDHLAGEIARLTAMREQTRGQIALLRHLIAQQGATDGPTSHDPGAAAAAHPDALPHAAA